MEGSIRFLIEIVRIGDLKARLAETFANRYACALRNYPPVAISISRLSICDQAEAPAHAYTNRGIPPGIQLSAGYGMSPDRPEAAVIDKARVQRFRIAPLRI